MWNKECARGLHPVHDQNECKNDANECALRMFTLCWLKERKVFALSAVTVDESTSESMVRQH